MRVEHDGVGLNVEVEGTEDGPVVAFLHGVGGSSHTYGWLPQEITDGRQDPAHRPSAATATPTTRRAPTCCTPTVATSPRSCARSAEDPPSSSGTRWAGAPAGGWRRTSPSCSPARSSRTRRSTWASPPSTRTTRPPACSPSSATTRSRCARRAWTTRPPRRGSPRRRCATARRPGDLMTADGLLARAHAHLVMDPEVLTRASDSRTLGETDVDAPVGVPVLILAADVQPAFKPEHEERMKATHPDVTVIRVAGAGHAHPRREGTPGRVRRTAHGVPREARAGRREGLGSASGPAGAIRPAPPRHFA